MLATQQVVYQREVYHHLFVQLALLSALRGKKTLQAFMFNSLHHELVVPLLQKTTTTPVRDGIKPVFDPTRDQTQVVEGLGKICLV